MPVKGCKNIYESFEKYTEKNLLVGDDQYEAPGFGKQDSAMGVWFNEYPPVLQLHLKRFTYDYTLEQMVKVHDRFDTWMCWTSTGTFGDYDVPRFCADWLL